MSQADLKPNKPGERKGGRAPGQPNKTTRILKDAILLAACEVGDVSMYVDTKKVTTPEQRGQLVGFLKWVAVNEPKAFCAMLGRLIPLQLTGSLDLNETGPTKYATREELIEEMKRRGLPVAATFANVIPPLQLPSPTNETSDTKQ